MRPFLNAFAVLTLAGPAAAQSVIDESFPAGPATFAEVHNAVAPSLMDPDSAEYRALYLVGGDGFMSICGSVKDGANSDAFRAFAYQIESRQAVVLPVGGADAEDELAAVYGCLPDARE